MQDNSFGVEVHGDLVHLDSYDSKGFDVNQSRLQFFLDCKRKYWWQFEQNLIPSRPRWALEVGKAVHLSLAKLGAGGSLDEATKLAEDYIRSTVISSVTIEQQEIEENVVLCKRMVGAYLQQYGPTPPWQALGVEVSGRVEVGKDTGVFIVFRTDRLVNWANRIWIVDHKTAAKLDMRDLMKYEMDLQFSAYTYAASKVLETRVAGVIVDMLVKTKIPQFHQQPFVRSDKELVEFEDEFVELATELKWRRARVRAGANPKTVFYKNTKECFRYGTCPYRDLCLEDTPTKRMLFLKRDEDYVDNTELLKVKEA